MVKLVIEDDVFAVYLFVEEAASLVPLLAVLAAASNVGDRQVAEVLYEEQLRYRKAGARLM